ncbi:glycosyltransferase [Methanoculleus sp.]|uniref:glycosyltransferase n=1 Tax=Methanoculleus sp. TaxID=90427 RepID=UPI0025EA8BA3|nr:glycosyltransferase [Methanoculleus sp.]
MPAVSVVIPLYNKRPHIARAVTSVLAQTVRDVEVIVVDDGSTDGGAEVVRGFDRVRLIRQENRGVSAARNRGIAAARGELVAFLDADDEWMPGHLEALVRLRERYPCAGIYATAYLISEGGGRVRAPSLGPGVPPEPWEGLLPSYFKAAALGEPPLSASTVAVPRSILHETGGFDTRVWSGEDVDLWGRIALKYPVAFTRDGPGIYHKAASNRACTRREPIPEHPFIAPAERALRAGEVAPALREDLLEYMASRQIIVALHNLEAGRPDLARAGLKGCRTRRLRKLKYWALLWAHLPGGVYPALRPGRTLALYNAGRARLRDRRGL